MAVQPQYDPLDRATSSRMACPRGRAFRERSREGIRLVASFVGPGKINGTGRRRLSVSGDGEGDEPRTGAIQHLLFRVPWLVGDGNGMIPSRGFRRPPSFHTELLRTAKTGHFFDVMTNGFGSMPSYARAGAGRGPLGHHRLHPRAADQPERNDQRPSARHAREARRRRTVTVQLRHARHRHRALPAHRALRGRPRHRPQRGRPRRPTASSSTTPGCRATSSGSPSWPARWPC